MQVQNIFEKSRSPLIEMSDQPMCLPGDAGQKQASRGLLLTSTQMHRQQPRLTTTSDLSALQRETEKSGGMPWQACMASMNKFCGWNPTMSIQLALCISLKKRKLLSCRFEASQLLVMLLRLSCCQRKARG